MTREQKNLSDYNLAHVTACRSLFDRNMKRDLIVKPEMKRCSKTRGPQARRGHVSKARHRYCDIAGVRIEVSFKNSYTKEMIISLTLVTAIS